MLSAAIATLLLLAGLLPIGAKQIGCTEWKDGRQSCEFVDRNITWPGTSGSDWWSLSGAGAVEWWWDDKTEDKLVFFWLEPVVDPRPPGGPPGPDGFPPYESAQWWLLDASAKSSDLRLVIDPIKYAMPGHNASTGNLTDGQYRLIIATPAPYEPFDRPAGYCNTSENMLEDARTGKPVCFSYPDKRWPALLQIKTEGADMQQVAEIKGGKRVSSVGVATPISAAAALALVVAAVAALA